VAAGIVGDTGYRQRKRKKVMLAARVKEAFKNVPTRREQMRKDAMGQ
jgi:hypothetical protein